MSQTAGLSIRRLWEGSPQQLAFRWALIGIILLGLGLRLAGHVGHPIAFWQDEAFWAKRLLQKPLLQLTIRPIAYMWITKELVETFGATEFWFRFLPNSASLAALLLAPYIASQLFASRLAQLFLVFLMALHPALIDLAREFKPYSFEVFVHMVPLALYLRYRQTGRRRHYVALLVALPLLLPFAYNIVFVYPGVLTLILWKGWTERRRGMVAGAVLSGLVCVGALAAVYSLTLHRIKVDRSEAYWGRKYDVFYVGKSTSGGETQVKWSAEKYGDVAALPGLRRLRWKVPAEREPQLAELQDLDRLAWVLLHLLGIVSLACHRRRDELLLLVLPLLVVTAVNVFGRWPMGAFRTNLFLCVYAFPIPIYGLLFLAGSAYRRAAVAVVMGTFLVLPGLAWGLGDLGQKNTWTRGHQMPEVLDLLRAEREKHLATHPNMPREVLLMDTHTAHSFTYYMQIHPSSREENQTYFRKNFAVRRELGDMSHMVRRVRTSLRTATAPIWVVVSKGQFMGPVYDEARHRGRILFERRFGDDHLVLRVAPL